ncbi:DUF421 domain-containing protein [Bacillus tianshenii]|nr:DUF421 domain-containing protein [Bacillus tianshenii]
MDISFIWKAALITLVGTLLLRISGRRSISQMTVSQTVIMISIGTILIQPVSGNNIWRTFATAAVLIVTLLLLEYIQMKSNTFEKLITGQAKPVIENGVINQQNLMKMRLSVDALEMRLRQSNISSVNDVKWATLEPSGQLGYMLLENKQPATKEDIQQLMNLINSKFPSTTQSSLTSAVNQTDLFTEVVQKENIPEPPPHLQ